MRLGQVLASLALAVLVLFAPAKGGAFSLVVQPGETLASIAERVYGRVQYERILVAANELDLQGGLRIFPGMRLEVPAVAYRRVQKGDTWASIAQERLGSAKRADVLATANGTNPWLAPDEGAEVLIPYNLRLIVSTPDTLPQVAYRYLGDAKKAWSLQQYNAWEGVELKRGDVLLVPLTDLPLTAEGKGLVGSAQGQQASEGRGEIRANQLKVARELAALVSDVRGGRYVDAVRRGNTFLAQGELTRPQLSTVHRQLLEAYVALGAIGLAAESCDAWQKAAPGSPLDPTWLSPKILNACRPAP